MKFIATLLSAAKLRELKDVFFLSFWISNPTLVPVHNANARPTASSRTPSRCFSCSDRTPPPPPPKKKKRKLPERP